MSIITNKRHLNADYEFIARFFDFDLSEKEQGIFEQRMKNEPDFFRKIQNYQAVSNKIEAQFTPKEFAAKQQLQTEWKQLLQAPTRLHALRKIKGLKMMGIAASFLVLFAAAWWWIEGSPVKDIQVLAIAYYKKTDYLKINHQTLSNVRSEEDNTAIDIRLINAHKAIAEQEYQVALELLNTITDKHDFYTEVLLLKGQSYFELKQFDLAIQQFQTLIRHPNGKQKDVALWYQALAYLQEGNLKKAKSNLEKIVTERYPIAKEASELLKKIE